MSRLVRLFVVAALVTFGLAAAVPPAAAAINTSSVVWGSGYSHSSYTFHQVRNRPGPLALHSPNGYVDFVVNANGDLSTSKLFWTGNGDWWYPYWRAHSDGRGVYFHLQTNGELVEKAADNKSVVWRSGKSVSGKHHFALVLSNLGTLTEYYASGDPLASGHHQLWQMGRVVGALRNCGGGAIDSGTSSYDMLVQNGAFDVKVHNVGIFGMLVNVYRWWGKQRQNPLAAWVGPGQTHDFGKKWYGEDNTPELVTMRADTTASNPAAALIVTGYCWYQP